MLQFNIGLECISPSLGKDKMNTLEIVAKAGEALKAAPKDLKALDVKTLRRFVKAAHVVQQGQDIIANPAKYETALTDRENAAREYQSLPDSVDNLARAQTITRFSAASRKASKVTKLEAMFNRI